MNSMGMMRFLPITVSVALLALAIGLWPDTSSSGSHMVIAWLNVILVIILAVAVLHYGVRLLRERSERRPGSRLRAKLVMALVTMLLVPTVTLQIAASQMVERGLDVWFDVRVDTLLDRALNLARGFYSRVETELTHGLQNYMHDTTLILAMQPPVNYIQLNTRLAEIREKEGWQRLQLFDIDDRLLAGVQESGLSALEAEPLGQDARLASSLGQVVAGLKTIKGAEVAVAYAPLMERQNALGLLRVQVSLPPGVVQHARAVETDYRTYRELERNRQSIKGVFTNAMLIITLVVILFAAWVALIFARRLTAPIGGLAAALHRVTEGDLDVTIPEAPADELGSLVRSFNRMTQRLKENVQALEQAREELTRALGSSRQRQEILETLLANLQTGVLLVDAEGRIRLFNQALKLLLALPSGWMQGRSLKRLCSGRLKALGHFFDELQHQNDSRLQRELDIIVGKQNLHILARGAHLSVDDVSGMSGYILVLDDVSSLAEAQRHRAWGEVARRLAHEIKNPLTPIKLAAERLQRRFRGEIADGEVFDTCTGAIISQVERLQRLVGDFSTMARLPKPRLVPVEVQTLLLEMRELYASYPRFHVEAEAEGVSCLCDCDQVRQVLINLTDNALAATAASGAGVRMYIRTTACTVEFHIEDDGEGIDEEGSEHIFEPYFSTKEEGSGLGLAIAKRIAEEHEGELLLVSTSHPTHLCLQLPVAGKS